MVSGEKVRRTSKEVRRRVAERRNRTLIEAARTMLADSKLPTTFWAEAVNTACYVQNRVLVTDEGFFVGYSLNSKAFRVFNSRTRIVEENLHIRFSESTPNVVGTKASDNAGQARKETEHVKDYILLPLWTADPPFSQDPKSSHDDGSKPSSDDGKKVDEDLICGDPIISSENVSKPPTNTDQEHFIGRIWIDNGEDEVKRLKKKLALYTMRPMKYAIGVHLEP
ncbi:retrovirus-related pol polyprotein from transposon TNT 1-94 [Tanacetum coccineum]